MVSFCDKLKGHIRWNVKCVCGNFLVVHGGSLKSGHTKSCGCLQKEITSKRFSKTDNFKDRPIYKAWMTMIKRCTDNSTLSYKDYGDRGIKVCERWMNFEKFYADMGDRPKGMSLDRIDNNGNYCKENCRWATKVQQANNTRRNHLITYNGETKTIAEWSRELKIGRKTLRSRLLKWSIEKALTEPLYIKNKRQVNHE